MKKIIVYIAISLFILTACEAVFVENISNKSVILISPSNEVEVIAGEINFNWNSVEDAKIYQLQIAIPNFNKPIQILTDTVIDKTKLKQELIVGEYEWRVKAKNNEYETEYSTSTFIVK